MDLSGRRFGKLLVVSEAERSHDARGHAVRRWLCRCDCGREKLLSTFRLIQNHVKSCGCSHGEHHGMRHSIEYGARAKILAHAKREGHEICDEWKISFVAFYEDMGPAPSAKARIIRLEDDEPYSRQNCIWIVGKKSDHPGF